MTDPRPEPGGGEAAPPAPDPPARAATPAPRDRWAHRRAEPRVFVLVWTSYLFAATLLALAAVSASSVLSPDVYRPAARLLIVTVAAGVVLLWPMIRLSQLLPPAGGLRPALRDAVIVILPAQAVIWPQWSLAGFPLSAIACSAAWVAAWGVFVGAILAHALTTRPEPGRDARLGPAAGAAWMLVFIALAAGGSTGVLVDPSAAAGLTPAGARAWWMLSPITGVLEILADRSWTGAPARAAPGHWIATAIVAGASLPAWLIAHWRGVRARPSLH